jgi:hypothetical protein
MKTFVCTKCGKEYDNKPEKCECGNDTFTEKEIVIDNIDKNEIELLKKQNEAMQKQIQMIQENALEEKKRYEKTMEEIKVKGMTEAEQLEFKRQKEIENLVEQQNRILSEYEKSKKENELLTKEKEKAISEKELSDFRTKKVLMMIEKPYLKTKIEKCDSQHDLDFMLKFIDENEEKAKWDADNDSGGSVIDIKGVVPLSRVNAKPKTIGEQLELRKAQRLEELKEKAARRNR